MAGWPRTDGRSNSKSYRFNLRSTYLWKFNSDTLNIIIVIQQTENEVSQSNQIMMTAAMDAPPALCWGSTSVRSALST
jgi:hypothetical protein